MVLARTQWPTEAQRAILAQAGVSCNDQFKTKLKTGIAVQGASKDLGLRGPKGKIKRKVGIPEKLHNDCPCSVWLAN